MFSSISAAAVINAMEWLANALSALFLVFLPLELYRRYKQQQ